MNVMDFLERSMVRMARATSSRRSSRGRPSKRYATIREGCQCLTRAPAGHGKTEERIDPVGAGGVNNERADDNGNV